VTNEEDAGNVVHVKHDAQKASIVCSIGTQPFIPAV
jgi:hypothetical protein